jgi:putative heme transporter
VLRVAIAAWAIIGVLLLVWVIWQVVTELRIVVAPMLIALFPALVLTPVSRWLSERGLPPALASLLTILASLAVLGLIFTTIGRAVAQQFEGLAAELEQGYQQLREWLAESRFRVELEPYSAQIERLRNWATAGDGLGLEPQRVAFGLAEAVTSIVFGVVALFFYLKDGRRLFAWLPAVLPPPWDRHVDTVGMRMWSTLGGYFRGQLIVAFVDAFFIGLGLVILGVPLALPLAVLVFFGGFFPIVGATLTGALAAFVALTSRGFLIAAAVLVIVILVQQLEGNVLEPYIVGRATRVHPFLLLVTLTASGALYGLLGAFLAVPGTAAALRVVEYVREQAHIEDNDPEEERGPPDGLPPDAPGKDDTAGGAQEAAGRDEER